MKAGRFVVERHPAGPFGAPVMARGGVNDTEIGFAVRLGPWIYGVGWLRTQGGEEKSDG